MNQHTPGIGRNSSVSCVMNVLLFCKQWREYPGPDFIAVWLEQSAAAPAALEALLRQGAALMTDYLNVARAAQVQQLGSDELDHYTLPDEVQYQVLRGTLVERPLWDSMRSFLQDTNWARLAYCQTLENAVALACGRLSLAEGEEICYVFVCQCKAFCAISCGHSACGLLLFDSHCLSLQETDFSGSCLCKDAAQILTYLTRGGPDALYLADQTTHLYASIFQARSKAVSVCRVPDISKLA